jgi:hypothetical protein
MYIVYTYRVRPAERIINEIIMNTMNFPHTTQTSDFHETIHCLVIIFRLARSQN